MATRQQRLDDFDGDGEPPVGEPIELLCEDHCGTSVRMIEKTYANILAENRRDFIERGARTFAESRP
jgi:hypothetical protein